MEICMVVVDKNVYLLIHNKLFQLNLTQRCLAQKINVSEQIISEVIRGLSSSPRIRHAIESILGEPIWSTPTTSEPDPQPIPPERKKKKVKRNTSPAGQLEINCEVR